MLHFAKLQIDKGAPEAAAAAAAPTGFTAQ